MYIQFIKGQYIKKCFRSSEGLIISYWISSMIIYVSLIIKQKINTKYRDGDYHASWNCQDFNIVIKVDILPFINIIKRFNIIQ